MVDRRWEYGSEFNWPLLMEPSEPTPAPWDTDAVWFGAGRDALCCLIAHGMKHFGWQRLWLPTYFCQEVVEAIRETSISVEVFSDGPDALGDFVWPHDARSTKDVCLVVNFLGLRAKIGRDGATVGGAFVIEDHTHDPWSDWAYQSSADFCVVSHRKTVPVPDGGVIWSPRRHRLPQQPSVSKVRQWAADQKRAAMVLKSMYLNGYSVDKSAFRELATAGEEKISAGRPSGITAASKATLAAFPLDNWRAARRSNHTWLANALGEIDGVDVLEPEESAGVPFSVVIILESQTVRDELKQRLLRGNIYPSILWPLEDIATEVELSKAQLKMSRCMLSLHCDYRYKRADLENVANQVSEALEEVGR